MTKRIGIIAALVVILLMPLGVLLFCSSVIEPGWVGVKVNMYGGNKGVNNMPVVTGRVFYNPLTTILYRYPTFMKTINWTASAHEGAPVDESMAFNSVEGALVRVDVSLAFTLDSAKVPSILKKFRQDITGISNVYLRSQVRDSLSRHASKMPIVKIYGEGKAELLKQVTDDLSTRLGADGFQVNMVSFVSDLRLDSQVSESIVAAITATNKAVAAENKIRETKAVATQQIESARGEAESARVKAEGQAKANALLTNSLTSIMVDWQRIQNQKAAIEKWDGKQPMVVGGATPMIQMPAPTQ